MYWLQKKDFYLNIKKRKNLLEEIKNYELNETEINTIYLKFNKNNFFNLKKIKVAFITNFTNNFLLPKLFISGLRSNFFYEFYNPKIYNNFVYEIIDNNSNLNKNKFDFIIFYIDPLSADDQKISLEQYFFYLKNFIQKDNHTKIIFHTFNYHNISSIDDKDCYKKFSKTLRLNKKIKNISNIGSNLLIDLSSIVNVFGTKNWYDDRYYTLTKFPLSNKATDYYSYLITNKIANSLGFIKKVLILDLDNTLWGGILGEIGFENIKIGTEDPISFSYLKFQREIKKLKNKGILLAIVSKNDFKIVKECFLKNKNLELKYNDFISIKANWNNKVDNIIEISKEINLSTDSFVFIDDNPVERTIVRKFLPEVFVPELPSDISNLYKIFLETKVFEKKNISKEDRNRTKSYIQDKKRNISKLNFKKYSEYLVFLKMTINISKIEMNNINRVEQLYLRTNQFNITNKRFDRYELKSLSKSQKFDVINFSLSDRYGNYGLISSIIIEKFEKNLKILNWVMSCRVLQRNLEYFIIDYIIEKYLKKYNLLSGQYIKSSKNDLVKNLYKNLGFKFDKKNKKWDLNLTLKNINNNHFFN